MNQLRLGGLTSLRSLSQMLGLLAFLGGNSWTEAQSVPNCPAPNEVTEMCTIVISKMTLWTVPKNANVAVVKARGAGAVTFESSNPVTPEQFKDVTLRVRAVNYAVDFQHKRFLSNLLIYKERLNALESALQHGFKTIKCMGAGCGNVQLMIAPLAPPSIPAVLKGKIPTDDGYLLIRGFNCDAFSGELYGISPNERILTGIFSAPASYLQPVINGDVDDAYPPTPITFYPRPGESTYIRFTSGESQIKQVNNLPFKMMPVNVGNQLLDVMQLNQQTKGIIEVNCL